MSAPLLLETKLFAPRPRRGLVARPRLTALLDRGAETKLTLVSAPPGFGKTTVLADWLASAGPAVAWVSLDPGDSDAVTFWRYVVAALRRARPEIGAAATALLESSPPPIDGVLASLLNDLAALPADVVLVLDDYHLVDALEIHEALAAFVDRLPPNTHVVVASRADPPLPLARLRVRGELVEIRAADLRFTADEAAAYLNETMGLALTEADVTALEARTEGWIAALQLAALSLQDREDPHAFVRTFAGDDRYVVDYLVEEVLGRLPDDVRQFLLETSILARLTGPLCDAVTGQAGGRERLEALDRQNLFLVPLDARRRWYRYHQLFADLLGAHLLEERPGLAPQLHRRASAWHAQHGDRDEAIRHAIAGQDFERAADLIELAVPDLVRNRREKTLRAWVGALPADLFGPRPVLAVAAVGARMSTGEVAGVEALLDAAERWLPATAGPAAAAEARANGMVVVDDTQFRDLPGTIGMYRSALALTAGDAAAAIAQARHALSRLAPEDHFRRGALLSIQGLASWTLGDLDAGYAAFADGMAGLDRAGFAADVVGGMVILADLRITQGRLGDALRLYQEGLDRATRSQPPLRGAADMHVGIADILRERGDLAGALAHLIASRRLGEGNGMPRYEGRYRIGMARVRLAEGDLDTAAALLAEARPVFVTDFSPNVRPIEAQIAALEVARGRLDAARAWAAGRGLSAADDVDYLREYEYLVLARLLIADGQPRDAVALTDRLFVVAEAGGRLGSALEVLVVGALARQAAGDLAGALAALDRALALAEPEGYVRVFLDEGAPMVALLGAASKQRLAPAAVTRLLEAARGGGPAAASGAGRAPARQPLAEPLSERELEVLRLLQGDLDGPAMASQLYVSLNTLRTHTKNVYAKLGVTSRRAAVTRAVELGLLPRG